MPWKQRPYADRSFNLLLALPGHRIKA